MSLELKTLADSNVRTMSIIYGQPGTGKTFTLSTLKGNTLLIDVDYGTASLPKNMPITVVQPDSVEEVLMFLTSRDLTAFDNVVLDNLSQLQNIFMAKYSAPEIQHWGKCSKLLMRVVDALARLTSKGVNVIVIAQEKLLNEDSPAKIMSTLNVMDSVRSYVQARSQIVGRTYFTESTGYGISFAPTQHAITKLSVYGMNINEVHSLAEIFDLIEQNGNTQPTAIPEIPDAYITPESEAAELAKTNN